MSKSVTYVTAPLVHNMVVNGNEVISFHNGALAFEFTSDNQLGIDCEGIYVKREDYDSVVGFFELLGLSFTTQHNAYFTGDLDNLETPSVTFRHSFKVDGANLDDGYRSILELFNKLKKEK